MLGFAADCDMFAEGIDGIEVEVARLAADIAPSEAAIPDAATLDAFSDAE